MKDKISRDWYKIKDEWYHCVTIIKNGEVIRYVNGAEQYYPETFNH
jgi:hypothetical protein